MLLARHGQGAGPTPMSTRLHKERIASLESVVSRDLGRNVDALGREARGGLADAARSIAECRNPVVAILTGVFMPWATPPAPETDGPIGTAELAIGLSNAEASVRVATESRCAEVVRLALAAAKPEHDIPVDVIPDADATAMINGLASRYQDQYGVTHAIAIERLGPGRDGRTRDMAGRDISDFTAPLHELFGAGDWVSIGIGDGGNELGMGSLTREAVSRAVPRGELIHCVVPCDHLIVSATSNWGAQALLAAIAILRDDDTFLAHLSSKHDIGILREIVLKGPAVDGVTQEQAMSVDGIRADELEQMMEELLTTVGSGMS